MNPAELNERFALPGLNFVEGPGGLAFAEMDCPGGSARLCLQGAHVVTWRPSDQEEPVVWVSEQAKYGPGKSIRGGAPVCWPWFGPHAQEKTFPGHGFARTVAWQVTRTETLENGDVRIALMLMPNDQTRSQFDKACRLELIATVGASLHIELLTSNLDNEAVEIGEALHTYFRIGDIGNIQIRGLESAEFVDKVDGGQRKQETGALRFTGEVDRVYLNTATECVIEDPDLKRRIRIGKTASQATVVWTPWLEKAEKMADFGPGKQNQGGWREMVCVESANALDNVVTIPAGESHSMTVTYSAEPL